MKVFIIAALVLVAQCQLHPAQQGRDPQIAGEEIKKPEEAQKDTESHAMPVFTDAVKALKSRFNDYYAIALKHQEEKGRRDDSKNAKFIVSTKNEAFDQLIPKDKGDALADPKNQGVLVRLFLSQSSGDTINMEDPKLANEGITFKNLLDKEVTMRKNQRTGDFDFNGVRAVLKPIEGDKETIFLEADDFIIPEMKQELTNAVRDQKAGADAALGAEGQAGRGTDAGHGGQAGHGAHAGHAAEIQ